MPVRTRATGFRVGAHGAGGGRGSYVGESSDLFTNNFQGTSAQGTTRDVWVPVSEGRILGWGSPGRSLLPPVLTQREREDVPGRRRRLDVPGPATSDGGRTWVKTTVPSSRAGSRLASRGRRTPRGPLPDRRQPPGPPAGPSVGVQRVGGEEETASERGEKEPLDRRRPQKPAAAVEVVVDPETSPRCQSSVGTRVEGRGPTLSGAPVYVTEESTVYTSGSTRLQSSSCVRRCRSSCCQSVGSPRRPPLGPCVCRNTQNKGPLCHSLGLTHVDLMYLRRRIVGGLCRRLVGGRRREARQTPFPVLSWEGVSPGPGGPVAVPGGS